MHPPPPPNPSCAFIPTRIRVFTYCKHYRYGFPAVQQPGQRRHGLYTLQFELQIKCRQITLLSLLTVVYKLFGQESHTVICKVSRPWTLFHDTVLFFCDQAHFALSNLYMQAIARCIIIIVHTNFCGFRGKLTNCEN